MGWFRCSALMTNLRRDIPTRTARWPGGTSEGGFLLPPLLAPLRFRHMEVILLSFTMLQMSQSGCSIGDAMKVKASGTTTTMLRRDEKPSLCKSGCEFQCLFNKPGGRTCSVLSAFCFGILWYVTTYKGVGPQTSISRGNIAAETHVQYTVNSSKADSGHDRRTRRRKQQSPLPPAYLIKSRFESTVLGLIYHM